MKFTDYQNRARRTDKFKNLAVSTLGLAYEAGSVLNTFQTNKIMGGAFTAYKQQLTEELGDCLWYLASTASIFRFSLKDIAHDSILRSQEIFGKHTGKKFSGRLNRDPNDIKYYCSWVTRTDIKRDSLVSVLGLIGEVGSICTVTKKIFRESCGYDVYEDDMKKELADCLWYISSIAINNNLKMRNVAEENLKVTRSRWLDTGDSVTDENYDEDEQFPRKFTVVFKEKKIGDTLTQTLMQVNGINIGDRLTDNSYVDDGYRYHDVFHLAYAGILGWSPVLRALFKRKRKSKPSIDEIEDGARATIVEEVISLLVYNHAKQFNYFEGASHVDDSILRSIQNMCQDLEVNICTAKRWEHAILRGYEVFRLLRKNRGGVVMVDLNKKEILYVRTL